MSAARFPLGRLLSTPGVLEQVPLQDMLTALSRHIRGDWGELSEEDRAENDLSLSRGFRLLSAYRTKAGVPFWIITEADRSSTTVLLPDEY
jgi:hypothetical protein